MITQFEQENLNEMIGKKKKLYNLQVPQSSKLYDVMVKKRAKESQ